MCYWGVNLELGYILFLKGYLDKVFYIYHSNGLVMEAQYIREI